MQSRRVRGLVFQERPVELLRIPEQLLYRPFFRYSLRLPLRLPDRRLSLSPLRLLQRLCRKDQIRTDIILCLLQKSQSSGILHRYLFVIVSYQLAKAAGRRIILNIFCDGIRQFTARADSSHQHLWQRRFHLPDRPAIRRERLQDCTLSPISCR